MTLVVGSVEARGVRLICDSQISRPDAPHDDVIPGRLKLVLLDFNTCIGFAGQPDVAIDAIRLARHTEDYDSLAGALLEVNRRSHNRVDFLVARFDPPRLEKISNGQQYSAGRCYWIGDPDAVNVFSDLLDSMPAVESENPDYARAGQIHMAFAQLLRDDTARTVGGLSFTVAPDRDGFRYAPEIGVFYPPQSIPSGDPTTLRFGTAEHGGYAFSTYTSNAPGIPAVGVYFLQGRNGCLYLPLEADEAEWFSGMTQEEFRDAVSTRAGAQLIGNTFN